MKRVSKRSKPQGTSALNAFRMRIWSRGGRKAGSNTFDDLLAYLQKRNAETGRRLRVLVIDEDTSTIDWEQNGLRFIDVSDNKVMVWF